MNELKWSAPFDFRMEDYESVLLVKNEVFIYKIPPLTTNKGYKVRPCFRTRGAIDSDRLTKPFVLL